MGFTDYHARILEAGSATKKGDSADPRLIRYNTGYYPVDVGVELVIRDIEDFRHIAEMQEPRLAVELEKMAVSLDCALASKSSENGRRMTEFRNEANMERIHARIQSDDMASMDYTKDKSHDRNKNY